MREAMLILHFLGLVMGVGTGFAFMFLGIAAGRMQPAQRREFMLNAFALTRMGHIGLGLLLLTGFYLITPYWPVLSAMPLLIAKLALVGVLIVVISINTSLARKARTGDAEVIFRKMAVVGRIALLTSIAIVILAVLVFR